MGFCDDPNTDLYGTYSGYYPEIVKHKTPQELEKEVEQLRVKVDKLEKCITDLKYIVASW